MPAPTLRERRAIAAAMSRLARGSPVGEVQIRLAQQLGGYTPTEIADAVRRAVIYSGIAPAIERQLLGGRGMRGRTLDNSAGYYAGTNVTGQDKVGITVYWHGTLQNGLAVKGSVVVNADADASIYRIRNRIYAALKNGYIGSSTQAYAIATLSIEFATVTPYGRDRAVDIDTSGVNPYR